MGKQEIKSHYKHIIVGGGIVGAGILRDLALHEEEALLIEKGDFSSQTSQGSSKMLHGGIRYLENFDFALVFEALREKKIWLKLSGDIAKEEKFYLPVYKHSKWPLFFLRIGLFIYDLLSLFKNPPYKILNKEQTLKALPGLNSNNLKGAGLYSDGLIDDSKLVFDLIIDAVHRGARAINYNEVVSLIDHGDTKELTIRDTLNHQERNITCENLLIAVGPFTDQVMQKLSIPWENIILPSKGTHLWLKKDSLELDEAMVLQTKDNRIIFVIPQRNAILAGTTEVKLLEDSEMFDIKASDEEIQYLIDTINEYFPEERITHDDIISTTAAVRPLVKSSWSKSSGKTSRKHQVYKPKNGIYVIAGGKYTTFRVMAKDICKKMFKDLGVRYHKNLSLKPFDKKSIIYDVHEQELNIELLQKMIDEEFVRTKDDLVKRRLSLYSIEQAKDPKALKDLLDQLPSI